MKCQGDDRFLHVLLYCATEPIDGVVLIGAFLSLALPAHDRCKAGHGANAESHINQALSKDSYVTTDSANFLVGLRNVNPNCDRENAPETVPLRAGKPAV